MKNQIDPNKEFLVIAGQNNEPEIFYTVEGEGRYTGYPSIFLRLSLCTLTCIGFKSPDSPFGCDSYVSWSKKNKRSFEEIAQIFEKNGFHDKLRQGAILKITGGEPLLWSDRLLRFVEFITHRWDFVDYNKPLSPKDVKKPELIIDFETNATIMPDDEWERFFVTYTTSPKLSNNGDPREKRFKPEVIKYLADNGACFKFVISKKEDLDEVYKDFINNPEIDLQKEFVWLMPMCGSRKELLENGTAVAEMCKEHGFKFSNRLHLQLWDKALLV